MFLMGKFCMAVEQKNTLDKKKKDWEFNLFSLKWIIYNEISRMCTTLYMFT